MARRKTEQANEPTQEVTETTSEQGIEREPGDEAARRPIPNPMRWTNDNAAGVEYATSREPYEAQIRFQDGKPSEQVRQHLKDNGFSWKPQEKIWARPIKFSSKAQDEETGRRVSAKVIAMIREEKGIPSEPGIPI